MTRKQVYELGFNAGLDAVTYCEVGEEDINEVGCDHEDRQTMCEDCLRQAAFEAEQNARQYSPFEHYAAEINRAKWDAYDAGVADGITQGLQSRLESEAAK
jgi:hypothetical protein